MNTDTYEYACWRDSDHHREQAWALSLGFDSATDYHEATIECGDEEAWQYEQFLNGAAE